MEFFTKLISYYGYYPATKLLCNLVWDVLCSEQPQVLNLESIMQQVEFEGLCSEMRGEEWLHWEEIRDGEYVFTTHHPIKFTLVDTGYDIWWFFERGDYLSLWGKVGSQTDYQRKPLGMYVDKESLQEDVYYSDLKHLLACEGKLETSKSCGFEGDVEWLYETTPHPRHSHEFTAWPSRKDMRTHFGWAAGWKRPPQKPRGKTLADKRKGRR